MGAGGFDHRCVMINVTQVRARLRCEGSQVTREGVFTWTCVWCKHGCGEAGPRVQGCGGGAGGSKGQKHIHTKVKFSKSASQHILFQVGIYETN